jgi:hypothetical protein
MGSLNGLACINIELTSRCNKHCWCCGRRKIEREYPEIEWGDMPYEMVEEIATMVTPGVVVQFHNNGDPLLYPDLGRALDCYKSNIRCFNSNGKLLLDRLDEIVGKLETLTISVIQDDPEGEEQYGIVREFIRVQAGRSPRLIFRLLGRVDRGRWEALPGTVVTRVLHAPEGSFGYVKPVTVPEIGVCLDLLSHLAIDRFGNISLCVRFDPEGHLRIGNIATMTLEQAWYSAWREGYIQAHLAGLRKTLPGCKDCDYWGVPRGE